MSLFEWNPVFNLVMKIKHDYVKSFGSIDTYDFEKWLLKLNVNEYTEFFSCLKVKQRNNYILIRYGMDEMNSCMWSDPDSLYRECRSVVIDIEKEQLVIASFRKFFNLNEVEENSLRLIQEELKKAKSVEITDKMDGSMQCVRFYKGDIFISGTMAIDRKESWRLEDGYSKLSENYRRMIVENHEYTFIFEYISRRDSHLVIYTKEQEGMYLIGMRNVFDGRQLSYNEVKGFAVKYNIPMTSIEDKTFNEVYNSLADYKSHQKEGWVINIDGHMIKLKCDDYIQLHRVLCKVSSINAIIKSMADGTYDDLLCRIPEAYSQKVTSIFEAINDYLKRINENIEKCYLRAPKEDRKEFMIWVEENCSIEIRGYLRQKYLGKDYNILKTCYNDGVRYKKIKEIEIGKKYRYLFADLEVELSG
ncbi:MAG: T4 RnlA family RNA ligase [Bacillota bacterium]|nr:T4 RnlA family RNA ligase [Bacillota bacterium]